MAYFWLLLAGQMFTPSAVENPQSALLSLASSSFICTSLLSSTVPIVSLISGVLLALARWSNVYSLCCRKPSAVIIPCFIFLHLYISSFLYCPHHLSQWRTSGSCSLVKCLLLLLLKTLGCYNPLLHLPSSVHPFFPLLSPSSLSLVALYFWLLLASQMLQWLSPFRDPTRGHPMREFPIVLWPQHYT